MAASALWFLGHHIWRRAMLGSYSYTNGIFATGLVDTHTFEMWIVAEHSLDMVMPPRR